jgi:hypothetical protein
VPRGRRAAGPELLLGAVEPELEHALGDQTGALAAGVRLDRELDRKRVEAPLHRALADVQRLGDLGARGGPPRAHARSSIGRHQGACDLAFLTRQFDRPARRRRSRLVANLRRKRDLQAKAADAEHVSVAEATGAVERLTVEHGAVAAVEIGRDQRRAPPLDLEVIPGDRLVLDADLAVFASPGDRATLRERDRARRLVPAADPKPWARRLSHRAEI